MRRSPSLQRLIELIYEGPLEQPAWQGLLRQLRIDTRSEVAAISLRIQRDGALPINVWDRRNPISDVELRKARENLSRFGHLDPLANSLKKSGDIFTLDEIVPRSELERSDYYRFILQPFGLRHQIGMHIAEPSGWRSNVGLMNGPDARPFGRSEKSLLRALKPHLERALQLHARIRRLELEKATLEDAFGHLAIGLFVLDADGRILEINKCGRELVERNAGLSIVNNRIALGAAKDNERLAEAVRDALAAREAGGADGFATVFRVSRKTGALSVLVRAMTDTHNVRNYSSPSAIVYVTDQTQAHLAPDRFVAELFGLSSTEARLATLLAGGLTLSEAAKRLGVTENTVRGYAKRTFGKAGVSRQADLVRLILTSVAPLARLQDRTDEERARH